MVTRVSSATGPLSGFEIFEVSGRPSGAYCGRLLHLLGATVVRADIPLVADIPVSLAADLADVLHAGKRSVAVDDLEALHEALGRCDLVVVDSRAEDAADGAVAALTSALLRRCPLNTPIIDLAGLRIGINDSGAEPCAPMVAAAASGMSWGIGSPDKPPLTLPYDIPDYLTGTEGAGAAALALLMRSGTKGSALRFDVTTTDVLSYYVGQIGSNFLPYGRPWRRDGARATMSGGSYPGAMFPCRDGAVSIMCRTQREYQALLAALGNPEWSQQLGFSESRIVAGHHADEADRDLIAWTSQLARDEVFAAGREHGFPVAPVLTLREALDQDQFTHRGFFSIDNRGRRRAGSPFQIFEAERRDASETLETPEVSMRALRDIDLARPLSGLRVLDLSWVWSGPMVTAALRDLGADVCKVENRKRADPARLRGRAMTDGVPVEGPELEVTPYFNQMNHGKRSVAIDITNPEGAALIRMLAAEADVVVENMRPGVLARHGLDYDALAARNPSLVMVSMSMLGQSGPLSSIRGYAPVMSGLAGLDSIVGYDSDHLIGTYNPALGDPNGAAHALVALLSGLVGRQRHGRGCYIDLSQVEALLSILPGPILQLESDGAVPVPANRHNQFAPHGTFACRGDDSWVSVAARTVRERALVADLIGIDSDVDEIKLTTALTSWISARSSQEVTDDLRTAGIPVSPVVGYDVALFGERAIARQVGTATRHPWLGEQTVVTLPWKAERAERRAFTADGPAPLLGADTDEVLSNILGLGRSEIMALRASGAIE
jgi:crotonobetainyl-CoA:carnitine CoA-transferase CaiB-like acyl-CoA transferase